MGATTRTSLQWTLVAFNTLSVVVGICAASFYMLELDRYVSDSSEYAATCVEIVAGMLLVVSAFIGCFGAVNGSLRALALYFCLLVSLFAAHMWKLCHFLPYEAFLTYRYDYDYGFERATNCGLLVFEAVGVLTSLTLICEITTRSNNPHGFSSS